MLSSLEIQNYRNFKHLRIEKLGRVNLIIGKNNTGKTSLLEAVRILVAKDEGLGLLFQVLKDRDEHFEMEDLTPAQKLKSLSNLFYNREASFDLENPIKINNNDSLAEASISFCFVKYQDKELEFPDAPNEFNTILSKMYTQRKYLLPSDNGKIGLLRSGSDAGKVIPLSKESISDVLSEINNIPSQILSVQFVSSNKTNDSLIFELWQKTQLTDSEEEVVKALRLLESDIQRVSFKRNGNRDYAIVKLKNIAEPVSLRSMGDGINRILAIILAMVNCKDGYLLIDEFDNGLHVSVQKQLWEIVFELANRLNIQVFATTHSYDCIDAFSEVLGSGKYAESDGLMVRLDNWQDNIEATIYEAKDIFNTTRLQIDPR